MKYEDRTLRKLEVDTWLTCSLDPDILGRAINRLEEVTFVRYRVSKAQLVAILRLLVGGESRLKRHRMHLDPEVVGGVDQDLIRRSIEKVGEFFST